MGFKFRKLGQNQGQKIKIELNEKKIWSKNNRKENFCHVSNDIIEKWKTSMQKILYRGIVVEIKLSSHCLALQCQLTEIKMILGA